MYEYEDIVNEVQGWFKKATAEEQKQFLDCPKEKLIGYHDTLGRDIRNEFKLWHTNWTPELDEKGCDCSPFHPDQISMSVIEDVWSCLKGLKNENLYDQYNSKT